MTHLAKSALVPVTPAAMFALVNDVRAYPKRFDWCTSAEVLESGEDFVVAELGLRMAGVHASFTTRNTLREPSWIRLELVEGPFSELKGSWTFEPLGDAGCKVSLVLDFAVAGSVVGSALAIGFGGIANRLVDDFVRVAKAEARK